MSKPIIIKNEDGSRSLHLDGEIAGEQFWGDEMTPDMFREELNAGDGDIDVYINSPGGDCIAASQIYNALREYDKGSVRVKIDGIAASAASVIAMAGDEVLMAPTAMLMIHNPATVAFGDHSAMEHAIDVLGEFKESIINAYVLKTGLARDKIADLMEQETWMNAKKAIELKFADGLIGGDGNVPLLSYSFAGNQARLSLVNKLTNNTEEPKTEDTTTPEETGRSVDILKRKLDIAKNRNKR